MDLEARLAKEIVRRIQAAREEDDFANLKPSLLSTARKLIESHPSATNDLLQTVLDHLRQETDYYVAWALENEGAASTTALEQVRILISQRGGVGMDQGLRHSAPLDERAKALLKLLPPIDEDDRIETRRDRSGSSGPDAGGPPVLGDAQGADEGGDAGGARGAACG